MTAARITPRPVGALAGALARALGGAVAAALAVAAAVVVLPYAAGRDPALSVLRSRLAERDPDAAAVESVRRELDLPAGPLDALASWAGGLLRGDLGRSWVSGEPVLPPVLAATGVSLTMALSAALVAAVVAAGLTAAVVRVPYGRYGGGGAGRGSAAPAGLPGRAGPGWLAPVRSEAPGRIAVGSRGAPGRLAERAALALGALPELLLAAALVWLAALGPGWPHVGGWTGPADLVLPAVAVGLPLGGVLAVVAQTAASDALGEQWVRTWTASGLPARLGRRAALRQAGTVAGPLVGLAVGGLLGGVVIVEAVFGIPGLGRAALAAGVAGDLPVLQATLLVTVLVGLAAAAGGQAMTRALLPAGAVGSARPAPRRGTARSTGLVALLALAAMVLAGIGRDPQAAALGDRLLGPGPAYPLGTDLLGRDVLARTAHGAVATLGPAVLITVVCCGAALLLAGLVPAVTRLAWVGNALPAVVVGLLVVAAAGPGAAAAVVAVAAVAWVPLAVHAGTLFAAERASAHVEAARVIGLSETRILLTEMLPAVSGPVVRHAVARLGHTALALTGLTFLGLGAAPPSPQWGRLLQEGLPVVDRAPLAVLGPAAALLLTGLAARAAADLLGRVGRHRRQPASAANAS